MLLPNSVEARDLATQVHSYTNLVALEAAGPLVMTEGQGIYVTDNNGKTYLDGMAGLWSASLGFKEDRLAVAAARQFARMPFYHNFFGRTPDVTVELAEKLQAITPDSVNRVYFANSGSEANDLAIKLVWYYNNSIGRPEKKKIISRFGGYHGITIATASLTRIPINQTGFDLPIDRVLFADCPHHYLMAQPGESQEAFASRLADNLDALILAEGPDTVAAFIAEPVMAAGGVIVPPAGYFEKVQAVLKKHDVLFLCDEVVCGFGRTGNLFGAETFGIRPDTMTLAKALSASHAPISALVISEEIFQAIKRYSDEIGMFGHGSTYSGHPVSAAVALETLKIYEDDQVLRHVRTVSPHFMKRLLAMADHPLVGEARGIGLLGAIEMMADKAKKKAFNPALKVGPRANAMAQQRGLILRARGDALTICPPLIISEIEIDELFDKLWGALDDLASEIHEESL